MFSLRMYMTLPVILLLLQGDDSWETTGTSFIFPLLATGDDEQSYITVFGKEGTLVELKTEDPHLATSDTIDESGVLNITLSYHYHVSLWNNTSQLKAVHLSSNDTVAVNVITKSRSSAAAFNVIPDVVGGYLRHRLVTHCPELDTCSSFIALAGIMNSFRVIVNLRGNCNMTVEGAVYANGDSFSISVMKLVVKVFKCNGDLSGSEVFTAFPINVFSGSFCSDDVKECDLTMEHIPPRRNLGSEYTLPPFPPDTRGFYRLVGTYTGTNITDKGNSYTLDEGDYFDIENVTETRTIRSSSSVLIAMLFTDTQGLFSKAMIIMQPASFKGNASRVLSPTGFTSYCQLSVDTELTQPWLNDRYLCDDGIYQNSMNRSVYFIPVPNAVSTIGVTDVALQINIFGFSSDAIYGHIGIPWTVGNISTDKCEDLPLTVLQTTSTSTLSTISEGTTNVYNFHLESSSTQTSVAFEQETTLIGTNVGRTDLPNPREDSDTSTLLPTCNTASGAQSGSSFQWTHLSTSKSIMNTFENQASVHDSTYEALAFEASETFMNEQSEGNELQTSPSLFSDFTKAMHSGSSYGISISAIHPTVMSFQRRTTLDMTLLSSHLDVFSEMIISMKPSIPSTDEDPSLLIPVPMESVPRERLSSELVQSTFNAVPATNSQRAATTLQTTATNLQTTASTSQTTATTSQATATTAQTTASSTSPRSILCTCNCMFPVYDPDGLQAWINAMRRNLTVDKDTLSATIRQRISVSDPRRSATGVGAFGTGIVVVVFILIFMGDFLTLLRYISNDCGLILSSR